MDDRQSVYAELEGDLSPAARAYWAEHSDAVRDGLIHAGKFENYFRLFRLRMMPLMHGRRDVEALLADKSLEEQVTFYRKRWNNLRWRLCFKLFFSRWMMARLGRDPEFFRYVEGRVADRILERAKHGFTAVPVHANPYLNYIFTGNFPGHALPRYLRAEHFDAIRAGLDRMHLHHGSIEDAAREHGEAGWDGFNLSDIFEYINDETAASIYAALLDGARPHARFAYWNMLVPRRCPEVLQDRVQWLEQASREGFLADKAFFYSAFVVEEVLS